MPIASHVIIKARWNYSENSASNEEISEYNDAEAAESDIENTTKDFSKTPLKTVDDGTSRPRSAD
jgi:hypothetical protein